MGEELKGEIEEILKTPVYGEKDLDRVEEDAWIAIHKSSSWQKAKREQIHDLRKEKGLETGIETELTPPLMTLKKFYDGIKIGLYEQLTEEEAESIANEQTSKNSPPLTGLSEEEKSRVTIDFTNNILYRVNSSELTSFAGNLVEKLYSNQEEGKKLFEELQEPESEVAKHLQHQGIRYFFNSEKNKISEGLYDSYGYSEEKFDQLISEIRKGAGKQKIKMLDIGGGSGRALDEVKKHDSNIETFNITVDEEPAMYPVDHTLLCPIEHMPKELEEQADFIVSRTTWRYFTYPDIALRNAIKALSVGGIADLYVIFTRSSLKGTEEGKQELNSRIKSVFNDIRRLEQEGYIETNFSDADIEKFDMDTDGFLKIRKKKGLKEVEF